MELNMGAIHEWMDRGRKENLQWSGQWTLGQLIHALEYVENKEQQVYFDFAGCYPTSFMSWRGSYRELALTWDWQDAYQAPTVQALLAECRNALDITFEGYKGGEYKMDQDTPLWVDNYGKSNYTGIVGLYDLGDIVIIKTQLCLY